jgi:hypothetical protein
VEQSIKEKIKFIMNEFNANGLKWKEGKDFKHLSTRKEYGHIPHDFSMKDYENVIMNIINDKESDVYLYYVKGFKKNYFVFGDGKWIVIVGEDAIMETSFPIESDYFEYLSKKKGYEYLGKVVEVCD